MQNVLGEERDLQGGCGPCLNLGSWLGQSGRHLLPADVLRIVTELAQWVCLGPDVEAFVSFFPESQGGLHPFAVALVDPNPAVGVDVKTNVNGLSARLLKR